MRVTFKDVGQGDSIILEWDYQGIPKTGIVDCRRYQGRNPIVEHIVAADTKEISFIFLTHPHQDHFSGMLELLEYCEQNDLKIRRFVHTLRADGRWMQTLKSSVGTENEFRQLIFLLHKVDALLKKGIIRVAAHAEIDWSIPLNSEWILRNHSPSEQEMANYHLRVASYDGIDAEKCKRAANLLSTILTIQSVHKDSKAILTSDAEIEAFDRIRQRNEEIFDGKLLLLQVPHHGSKRNHSPVFWSRCEQAENCAAVFSVGEHAWYQHPDAEVVQFFESIGCQVFFTNHENGLKTRESLDERLTSDLNAISEEIGSEGQDLVFRLNSQSAVQIPKLA